MEQPDEQEIEAALVSRLGELGLDALAEAIERLEGVVGPDPCLIEAR